MNSSEQEQSSQPSRPPNRPSIGMRYGDIRSQLRDAASARAQRHDPTKASTVQDASSNSSGEPIETSSTTASQSEVDSAPSTSTFSPSQQQQDAPDFEGYDIGDLEMQSHADRVEAVRRHREARAQEGVSWKSCFDEPSAQWKQRKCNIYLHIAAALMCLLTDQPKCGIPLGGWLCGQFIFLVLEGLTLEMRERINTSIYWSENRGRRKLVTYSIIGLKELAEVSWQIFGATLYFSSASDGCSDENSGFMVVMVLFLILGALKLILVIVVLFVFAFVMCTQRLARRNQRNASKDILRSLGRIKYSALGIGQNETDEECSICFCEYGEEDIVTKLECNEKHIFHEECISTWIRQGKNTCPICRAPISQDIQI